MSQPLWFTHILGHLKPTAAKLDGVRWTRGGGIRSAVKLGEVRLVKDGGSRDGGSKSTAKLGKVRSVNDGGIRSTAKLGEVRRTGVWWFKEVGRRGVDTIAEKIAEVLQRSLIVGSSKR
ncbi:hypothetical protein TREMEDRAFT_65254 [Tremella mesenterica DSM 1558]|uniref:uncharacterized protein n=1 Tax=Tremella mesenterica (strain ATCC 24925 / CBS 8224 / DSM 1558 / NBRC 9311 / NRRL Y-6157 / RJB 2259-6 / UBC 559-6) TaxID=578456 RepID=UPI00032D3700|nr:uncharacterized protein TREMEDRAFT_65254 [Tremella mesenterica DSM 1558]EIW66847.1 hypothetical protein TREMEDRAFT_65254 [Tremella mesenterica DSM 1558]